ncbi:12319_t:CDS:2, partial [Funneliformis caledonium]
GDCVSENPWCKMKRRKSCLCELYLLLNNNKTCPSTELSLGHGIWEVSICKHDLVKVLFMDLGVRNVNIISLERVVTFCAEASQQIRTQ